MQQQVEQVQFRQVEVGQEFWLYAERMLRIQDGVRIEGRECNAVILAGHRRGQLVEVLDDRWVYPISNVIQFKLKGT